MQNLRARTILVLLQLYKTILEKELKKTSKEVGQDNKKVILEINKNKERISQCLKR